MSWRSPNGPRGFYKVKHVRTDEALPVMRRENELIAVDCGSRSTRERPGGGTDLAMRGIVRRRRQRQFARRASSSI
jgi:hypothetical protein